MIAFTFETPRLLCWTSVSWWFVLLAALCCCNGLLHQKTVKMADPSRSASESSTVTDTAKQHDTAVVDLGDLLDAEYGAMVTLVAGDTRLAAHRAVLAAGSTVLAAMFRAGTLETSSSVVNIPDVEGPVLRQLVAYLYTGRTPQLPGMAFQLLAAAEKYGVSGLKDAYEQELARELSVENAAATAVLAIRYNCHSLRKAVVAFIIDHLQVVATKGWARATLNHPVEVMQITRLLTQPPAKTSDTAATYSTPTSTSTVDPATSAATATATDSTPIATASPFAAHAATTANNTSTADSSSMTSAATATTTAWPLSVLGQATVTASLPTAGCDYPPPDAAAVSRLWSLSAKEKGKRLIQAAQDGSVHEVKALLAAGADAQTRGEKDSTALQFAAARGHLGIARCLLQAGAEVDARDSKWHVTPLHLAAGNGHLAVVRLLLAANANPNTKDGGGGTALHWAAADGQTEVAAVLLQVGADKEAKTNWGETALELARRHQHQQLIQMLQ